MKKNNKGEAWQALRAFYKLKSLLLPEFIQRNKRALNLLEAKLIEQYKKYTIL